MMDGGGREEGREEGNKKGENEKRSKIEHENVHWFRRIKHHYIVSLTSFYKVKLKKKRNNI